MNLAERIDAVVELGEYLAGNSPDWQDVKQQAYEKNGWFTPEFTQQAAGQIAEHFLQKEKLAAWCAHYHIDDNIRPKNIGKAGNLRSDFHPPSINFV